VAGINAITEGNPELRAALLASLPAIGEATFLTTFAVVPVHTRASLLIAFRDAARGLHDRRPCDLCEAQAAHVRFLSVGRSEYARVVVPKTDEAEFVGFLLACPTHASLTDRELAARMVRDHADVLRQAADTPFRRPAIFGARIGEAGSLPRRHALQECEDCHQTIWIDQDEADRIAPEAPIHLCGSCGIKRAESGRLEAVPMFVLGGLS